MNDEEAHPRFPGSLTSEVTRGDREEEEEKERERGSLELPLGSRCSSGKEGGVESCQRLFFVLFERNHPKAPGTSNPMGIPQY